MSKNTQAVDLDGDGKADIEVKKRAEAKPKAEPKANVRPAVPEGTQAPDADQLGEFQKQKAQTHLKIVINSTNDPAEVKRFYVGAKGVPYTRIRDVPVIVPRSVVGILNDARETRFRDGPKGPLGQVTKVPYQALSYPFQILGEVATEDVEAERKKIADEYGLPA